MGKWLQIEEPEFDYWNSPKSSCIKVHACNASAEEADTHIYYPAIEASKPSESLCLLGSPVYPGTNSVDH